MAPTDLNTSATGSYCTTPVCLEIASNILENLAVNYTEVDPCTDFDKLACGGYKSRHAPAAGAGKASTLGDVGDEVSIVLKNILEGGYQSGANAGFITASLPQDQVQTDKDNFKLIVDAYNACLNTTEVEAAGLTPLISFIDRIVKAFPVSSGGKDPQRMISKDDAPEMGKALLLFSEYGINTFETLGVDWDDQNPNKTIISLLPGGTSILTGREDNETVTNYLKIQASVLQAVHPANISQADSQRLAVAVTKFEKDLKKVQQTDDSKDADDKPLKKMKFEDAVKVAPELDHGSIIKALAPEDYNPEHIVFSPAYFGNLSSLLANTSAEVVQTFFVWKATTTLSSYVEAEATENLSDFRSVLRGLDPVAVGKQPRWDRCVSDVDSGPTWTSFPAGLGWILSRFFLDKAYSREARELTTSLMGSIQGTFIARLVFRQYILHRLLVLSIYHPARGCNLFSNTTPKEQHELLVSARAAVKLQILDSAIWSNWDLVMITWACLIVLQGVDGGVGEPDDLENVGVHLQKLKEMHEPKPSLRGILATRLEEKLQGLHTPASGDAEMFEQEIQNLDNSWYIFDQASLQAGYELWSYENQGG